MAVDVPVCPQLQQAEWSLDFRKDLTVEVDEGERARSSLAGERRISEYFLLQWLLVALLKGLELWPSVDGAILAPGVFIFSSPSLSGTASILRRVCPGLVGWLAFGPLSPGKGG